MKKILVAAVVLSFGTAYAGEWHTGTTNLCSDCHTMHFSMAHDWSGGAAPALGTPGQNGNWLGATGPNNFLLKAPANQLCTSCHDGQTFAPDVVGANINASPTQGRSAGALNEAGADAFKGHTLGATTTPPGFDPTKIGAAATWYDPAGGLECISCHAQHGPAGAYRNLGPYALGGAAGNVRPTYVLGTTNDTTRDVWINIASYTPNTGSAATFNPLFDTANISFNRIDAVVGGTTTSNKMDTFCAACHGNFHGGAAAGDPTAGAATSAALDGFARHPTSGVTIGVSGTQGYGGHSALSRLTGATTKVRVYASDRTGYTDASPGCLTCHKAHGNQNPFGLIFLSRNATSVNEQGGYAAGQTESTQNGYQVGYRNLCGQCHGQGN